MVDSMAWSPLGCDTEEKKLGVIITGLASGKIAFWNPLEMGKTKEKAEDKLANLGCLGIQTIEDIQKINCIAVNPFRPELFVSGGTSVLLHNIDKGFKIPDARLPSESIADTSPTTTIAWNFRVAHIFASAGESGTATVWDLKNKKCIMSISDPNYGLDSFSTEATM